MQEDPFFTEFFEKVNFVKFLLKMVRDVHMILDLWRGYVQVEPS